MNNTPPNSTPSPAPKPLTMAERYKAAYDELFKTKPRWIQVAILESTKSGRKDDSIFNDFIRQVVERAEAVDKKEVKEEKEEPYKDSCTKGREQC